MPKRSSKPKEAAETVPETATEASLPAEPATEKNPAAVALGKLGGKKGGPARAAKLTKEQRAAIARKAAQARWGKPQT